MAISFAISCECGEVMVPGTVETERGAALKLLLAPGWSVIKSDPDFDGGETIKFRCSRCASEVSAHRRFERMQQEPKPTIWSMMFGKAPAKGSFAYAWKLLLKGKKVRCKDWIAGVYIYANSLRLGHPECSFIYLGGLDGTPPTNWKPYLDDFSKNDWEEVISSNRFTTKQWHKGPSVR